MMVYSVTLQELELLVELAYAVGFEAENYGNKRYIVNNTLHRLFAHRAVAELHPPAVSSGRALTEATRREAA